MNNLSNIIDGKAVSIKILDDLKSKIDKLQNEVKPHLTFVLVGNNTSSLSYIRQKQKACQKIGIEYKFLHFPESILEQELLQTIFDLNESPETHGIMVQLPLPKHIDPTLISSTINPDKDVDGFHPLNQGNLFLGNVYPHNLIPCTPKGVIRLLQEYNVEIQGADAVVVGRSSIVGKPAASLLSLNGATVTICHSKTKDLTHYTKNADIIVVATGQKHLLKGDMVKPGVVVIDVGFSKVENDIYGDVDFDSVSPKAKLITPVPGGVGPMTVTCLMENVYQAFINQTS